MVDDAYSPPVALRIACASGIGNGAEHAHSDALAGELQPAKGTRCGVLLMHGAQPYIQLCSSKLTWKWRVERGSDKTTILYTGPLMGFHVNLGEGIQLAQRSQTSTR